MSFKWPVIFTAFCLLFIAGLAYADTDSDTAPLELTMDHTGFIHLDQDAASVIVANPEHVSVSLDNPRLLLLTPHKEGATSLVVLDGAGKTILEREVAVTNAKSKYVQVKRMCSGSDASCAAKSSSYCPDGCYEVTEVPANEGGAVPPPPARDSGSGSR